MAVNLELQTKGQHTMLERIKKRLSFWKRPSPNVSYSQCGEDLIIRHLFSQIGVYKPTYLDIGAHHPTFLNNTYLFYKNGSSGVNIEPDPWLFNTFEKKRPKDTNLNIGVGIESKNEEKDFFIMSARTLNTFSKMEAEKVASYGNNKIEKIIKVKTTNINEIVKSYFPGGALDLLTVDVEGLDYQIMSTFDFKIRPKVICVETLEYSEESFGKKNPGLIDFLIEKNYLLYADTYINTILVDNLIL